MANYITIDGGTTNTRVNLVSEGKVEDTVKLGIGVKNNTDGNSEYKRLIKDAIKSLLENNGMDESNICTILCSGMITSEYGLCELPHTDLPCGIKKLHDTMYRTNIEDISPIPFVFVRGVKADCKTLASADMMRGEETELFGLSEKLDGNALYILPGSHSKHILTDEEGRICAFHTEFTGELIEAVARNTILKEINMLECEDTDFAALQEGFKYCCDKGVNAAFFKVRALKNFFGYSSLQCAAFFVGAAMCSEINNIIKSDAEKVIIGGKKQLRQSMEYLIKENSGKEVIAVSDNESLNATANGIIKIYEYKENALK